MRLTNVVRVMAIASVFAFGAIPVGKMFAAVLASTLQKADAGRIERIYVESPQLLDSIVVDVWFA